MSELLYLGLGLGATFLATLAAVAGALEYAGKMSAAQERERLLRALEPSSSRA